MAERIRGQEVELIALVDGVQVVSLTNIKAFEMAYQLEVQSEGYLGQTTDQKDMIYKGVRGNLTAHFDTDRVFNLFNALVNKARRRTPGVLINLKATLNFSSGARPRIVIPNCAFGEIPISFSERSAYGEIKLEFEASQANPTGLTAGL